MQQLCWAFAILSLWAGPGIAWASSLDTVNWAPDITVDGTGTGVLAATNTVTYTTAVGFNAGVTYPEDWANPVTFLGTAGATGGAITYPSGGVLGGAASPGTLQTITFSAPVVQPTLLVAYLGGQSTYAADTFDFGANSFTLLSNHNALAVGNVVSGTVLDTDLSSDGFGIRFSGTFGPGTPLQFNYTSNGAGGNGLQSVAFTIGIPLVPEPSSFVLCGLGAAGLFIAARRRRKA